MSIFSKLPPLKYFITPFRWKAFIKGILIKWLSKELHDERKGISDWNYIMQVQLRKRACYDCVKKGYCAKCKCDIQFMLQPKVPCSEGKFGAMMLDDEFENFIKTYNIEV